MNNKLENKLYKKTLFSMIGLVLSVFSLYSIVFKTLYVKAETDIAFMIPIFVDTIPYITDLCEIIGILIAYSYIVYACYRFDNNQTIKYIFSFVVLTLYKYIATFAVTYFMNGSIPVVKTLLEDILLAFLLPFALEMVQFSIVLLLARRILKRAFDFIQEKSTLEGKLKNYSFDKEAVFFPFVKLWNPQNPLQKIAFWIGTVIMASKMLQLLIIDISVGLPQNLVDLLWIISAYSIRIILGAVSYLFVVWMFIKIHADELKL